MKKSLLFVLLLFCSVCYSQITLDFQNMNYLTVVRLNNTETKFLDDHELDSLNQFSLLNLDGTLYKTIHLPPTPDSIRYSNVAYISTSLFDNDPASTEYIVEYILDSIYWAHDEVKVVREDGTILLDEMNAYIANWNWGKEEIYNTPEGTKMKLGYEYAHGGYYQTKVFSLPGELPSGTTDNNGPPNNNLTLYPNPNNGAFYIDFHSKDGEQNFIDLYTMEGRLIETYKSNNTLSHITKPGLSEGLYLVNTRTNRRNMSAKMIIKK
jgi:hypothetical protein